MTADSNDPNIALIDLGKEFRGGQRQTLNLALTLRLSGIAVRVICDPDSVLSKRCEQSDMEIMSIRYNALSLAGSARKLAGYLNSKHVNIIHASESHGHTLGILTKLFHPDLKLIVTSRTYFGKTGFLSRQFKYSTSKVSKFVAISKAVAGNLRDKGVDEINIEVIYSSIDRDYFNSDDRMRNDMFTIGTACSLESGKGVDKIIKALGRIKEKLGNFRFKIAGEGPEKDTYELLAKRNGLKNKVKFTGFVDDMAVFYKSLDVYILASQTEGLGSSLIEAGACGALLIGTKVGGIVEVIEDGVDGFLYEYENIDRLSEILLTLWSEKENRKKMINEFEKKLKLFDIHYMTQKYIGLYKMLLVDH